MARQYRSPAERSSELRPRGRFPELRTECLAEVVRWRAYRGGKYLHRPEPLRTELHRGRYARWMGDEVDASRDDGLPGDAVRVGFDAQGRPVIARAIGVFPRQGKHQLLRYRDDYDEVVNTVWTDFGTREVVVVHLWRDDAGRVIETRDQEETVCSYRYDEHGRLEVASEAYASGTRWEYRCEYDATGALARIVGAPNDEPPTIQWDARLHAHESELPATVELLTEVAPGLARALAVGIEAAAAGAVEPRCVVLRPGGRDIVPLACVVLDTAYLRSMRRHDPHPDAAFASALAHHDGVHDVDVVEHAAPDVLRMLRQLDQRDHLDRWTRVDHEARGALMVELARRLNEPATGGSLPVVLWDSSEQLYELACSRPAWEPLRRSAERAMRRAEERCELDRVHNRHLWVPAIATAGQEAVEALWADLASYANSAPGSLPRQPPADRDELLRLLPAAGLERVADAISADVRDAIQLIPAAAGGGRSVLGGVPALPTGMDWPRRLPDRPLTPLAAIDCAELPHAAQRRELLPEDGVLLLFADLFFSVEGDEEELGWGIRTPADGWIAVAHVPAGMPTEPLAPPRELLERQAENGPGLLDPIPVTARIVPTLRDRWSAPRLLGLDAGEQASYVRLAELVQDAQLGVPQLLGHPLPVQGDPRAAGQELLFDLPPVQGFGFETPGLGTLSFVAAEDDLRAGRWDRVQATAATD